jgi:hypothetical protein
MPEIRIVAVNTEKEVTEWLALAQQCVDNAPIREQLEEIAFSKAVDLLAAKRMDIEPTAADRLGVNFG